jgi:hypothetical protein
MADPMQSGRKQGLTASIGPLTLQQQLSCRATISVQANGSSTDTHRRVWHKV